MSLIKCPECGKVFSDRAAHCPQCGLPTDEALDAITDSRPPVRQMPSPPAEQPQSPSSAAPPQDFRPRQQRTSGNTVLYILIATVIVLAIVCIVLLATTKLGPHTGTDGTAADSTTAIPELPADTVKDAKPAKENLPQVVESPAEQETEVLPEGSETEEIMHPAAPTAAPSAPAETTPAPAPETVTPPANAPAQ